MLLGGLWHGAAWTFVAWGAVHGAWLVMDRMVNHGVSSEKTTTAKSAVHWPVTFHIVCLTWLLFRAESMAQVANLLSNLVSQWHWTAFASTAATLITFFGLPWLVFEAWLESKRDDWALLKSPWLVRAIIFAALVFYLLFFPPPAPSEFIYFQF